MTKRIDEFITFEFDSFEHETDDAMLFLVDDEKIWIPKSQLDEASLDETNNTIEISEWIAEQKGII